MKIIAITIVFVSITRLASAQENKTMTVNPLQENTRELTASVFHYPQFLDGKVIFKDSVSIDAKMNYHRLFGQVLFVSPKNDTLALTNAETFLNVIIGTDTFYFFDKGFLRKLTHYKTNNLALKQTIKYIGIEKAGPYGSYSAVSASNSNSTVTTDNQITQRIELNENQLYVFNNEFFLSDAFNNFFKATKKNFYNVFSRRTKEIKEFLSANTINFDKQADLERLLTYIHGL